MELTHIPQAPDKLVTRAWLRRQDSMIIGGLTRELVKERLAYIRHKYSTLDENTRRVVDRQIDRLQQRAGMTHDQAMELLFLLGTFYNERMPR